MAKLRTWLQERLDTRSPAGFKLTASLLGAGAVLAAFAGILEGIREQGRVAGFDRAVGEWLISQRTPALTTVFETITGLAGIHGIMLFLVLAFALLWPRRYRRVGIIIALGVVIQGVLVTVIKALVERPRPDEALRLVHETSFSFPSGHTLAAAVTFGLVAYAVGRTYKVRWARIAIGAIAVLAVIAVAASRIYLGAHYPSDTLASGCLGAGTLLLGLSWLTTHPDGLKSDSFTPGLRHRLLAAVGLTILAVVIGRPLFV